MSLNNISLPPALVVQLYQNVLVQEAANTLPAKEPVAFLGNNEKNILILVNKKNAPYLPDKELAFLTTVLSACGLGLSDVAIVNWLKLPEKNAVEVAARFSPKQILLLDVAPQEFNLPESPLYTVQTAAGFQFVAAPSLSEIEKTKQTKSQLWMALKQLFCL